VQGEENRIACNPGDLEMEGDVGVGEALAVSYRLTVRLQRRLQRIEILSRCAARRLPRQPHLEEQPRSLEMALSLLRRQHLPHRRRHACEDVRGRRHHHARAGTVGKLDEACLLQRDQRLPDGRASYAEAHLKVAFGRQLVAGLQLAGQDLGFEMCGHVLEELLTLDDQRVNHKPFIPSCLTIIQELARMKV